MLEKGREEEQGLVAVVGVEGNVMSVVVGVEARGSNKERRQGVRCTHDTQLTAHTHTHTRARIQRHRHT